MSRKRSVIDLAKISDITMGQSPSSEHVNTEERGIPFLQGCAEFGDRSPNPQYYCSPPLRLAPSDSVLISVRAPVGTTNWADQEYCIGRGLASVKCINGLSITSFIKYSLALDTSFLGRRSQGSTFLAISAADLREFPVPVFDILEQGKIASILEVTDEAIQKTEALIEKYQKIKVGLMNDLFTRGIGADGKLRPSREEVPELYQETAIGWIPREWACHKLEDLLSSVSNSIRSGPFGSALLKSELVEIGIPFLGIDNVFPERFEAIFKRFVSEKKYLQLSKYAVRPGDVSITIMGTVGRSAVVPSRTGRALSSKHLWTMTFDTERVEPALVCWQLNYAPWVKSWFRQQTQGGIMDAIQSKTLRNLRLPVPTMSEQKQIHERYLTLSAKLDGEVSVLNKLKKQKSGLMQDLLTGKVSVPTPAPESTAA